MTVSWLTGFGRLFPAVNVRSPFTAAAPPVNTFLLAFTLFVFCSSLPKPSSVSHILFLLNFFCVCAARQPISLWFVITSCTNKHMLDVAVLFAQRHDGRIKYVTFNWQHTHVHTRVRALIRWQQQQQQKGIMGGDDRWTTSWYEEKIRRHQSAGSNPQQHIYSVCWTTAGQWRQTRNTTRDNVHVWKGSNQICTEEHDQNQ